MKFQPETMVGQPSRQRSAPVPGRCNVNGSTVPGTSTRRGMLISQRPGTGALRERGIALVVTLILLAVITFLTVAFLFLSTRERGAVTTQLDMTAARLATEAATERATVEMIAKMIATTNEHNYDLLVSRNIDLNIASLFYDPRPPVFPATNRAEQFYLDLNRNRQFDTNGLLGVLGDNGLPIFNTNGPVLNNFVGDPEWIGLLERNDRPHAANNRFKSRIAYIIVPEGKTLDVNNIHNAAGTRSLSIANDGFLRNQGVGTWELNMAAFLADLNTNYWGYNYQMPNGFPNTGTAFNDAQSMLAYRYGQNYANQRTVRTLFGNAATVLQADTADGYSDGNLMTGQALANDTDDIDLPWAGAENINHIFTTQDFFNPGRSSANFVNSLRNAGGNAGAGVSSYNRYTFYRMLSQLGADSGPEPDGKLHLNYVNVDASGKTVQDMQTDFVAWKPLQFFTNAANRMLKATFDNQQTNYARFGVPQITVSDIPVYVSNRFVYTPGIHRILQVSANVFDASTSRKDGTLENFPSVFRPVFQSRPNAFVPSITDLFIVGYTEVTSVPSLADPQLSAPLDISDPVDQAKLPAQISAPIGPNIYGVPWVIGAKKGFPNFNEFSMQSVAETSRRLQLRRNPSTLKVYQTNQLFNLSVSNMFAFEAWNSYQSDYQRGIEITVANDMTLGFGFTNDPAYDQRGGNSVVSLQYSATKTLPPGPNAWRGYGSRISQASKESFQIPLSANYTYLSNDYFRVQGSPSFTPDINVGAGLVKGFEQTGNFHLPEFEMQITNRIRVIMIDTATRRVIDYVQVGDMNGSRKLSSELSQSDRSFSLTPGPQNVSENMFWSTNRPKGPGLASPPNGVLNQIQASLGNIGVFNWNSVGIGQASGRTKEKEIDAFRNFLGMPSKYNTGAVATNNDVQAPFTPTRVTSQYISWQANDPLVHYTVGDLGTAKASGQVRSLSPGVPMDILPNIGKLNERFEPWGGNPSSVAEETPTVPQFSVEAKDPGVTSSDRWDFSTNKFASLGMLGRVHRGTPWQTLYLKSDDVSTRQWTNWTGNWSAADSLTTKPQMDRLMFDVFTAAVDANSTRGQLNVNQTNLAAWSAGLSGVIGLRNISNPFEDGPMLIQDQPVFIDPAGIDVNNSVLKKIYDGINRTRASAPFNGVFKHAAEVFATPELSVASPLLDTSTEEKLKYGITDATYERLPQMLIGLLRGNDQPRFTIYSYGQTLRPANRSIVTASGPDFNLCTNYQVTAEFATRTVVRIEGAPTAPRAVVESFNILPPD